MSKKNNGGFNNRAARQFRDMSKVDLMPQRKIYEILEMDIRVMLDQMTAYRNRENPKKKDRRENVSYPTYIANAFANLSTALFFKEYVECHVTVKKKGRQIRTDLSKDDIESLRQIISDAYTKSASGFYSERGLQEYAKRGELLSKAFVHITPMLYRMTKKLDGLSKSQRRELAIRIYGDPKYNMRVIHKTMNEVTLSERKKLKILRAMYGPKRFIEAVGAAMCVEGNNSDCLSMLYEYMMRQKKKPRKKYLRAYAEAYKYAKGTRYFRLYDPEFTRKNKKIIKRLIKREDIGFRKAFDGLDRPYKPKKPDANRKPQR